MTASPQLDHFFTANRSLPVGLLYKRTTQSGRLLRLGITVTQSFARRDDLQNPPVFEYTNKGFSLGLTVGREYVRPFSRRWVGEVGVDALVGYSYYRTDTEERRRNPATGLDPYVNVSYIQYNTFSAAAPFAGIRYQFGQHLYASAESQVLLSLSRLHSTAQSVDTQLDTGHIDMGNMMNLIDWNVTMRLRLINQLTVHYLF